jgi:uncharacterized surface protein with fasciclin (FAS1) repeats
MQKTTKILIGAGIVLASFSCSNSGEEKTESNATAEQHESVVGQSGVQDDVSAKNVVQVAIGSKDHSTLVAAVKAAELVDVLSNAGPFTVFAPTNAAFDKLPAGTVDGLLKSESKGIVAGYSSVSCFCWRLSGRCFDGWTNFRTSKWR